MSATNTIYLRNIPDSVSKNELKRSLYELGTEYGVLLDVVALKTDSMRGQAFLVYRDAVCAARALQGLNAFEFYGRRITAQYAQKASNAILTSGASN